MPERSSRRAGPNLWIHPFLIKENYDDTWYDIISVFETHNLYPFFVVKAFGAYMEVGCDCNRYNFYRVIDHLGIDSSGYTCGFGLFLKRGDS